ncbi:phytanoyl-CoA dioxygenase family protein [Streptomyces sp. TRM70350]|uniref:phytanoyl-CoA dioxygenase family protein n=1 Tax=Streptomyces sp. TRM70350 TaxID=2856165 RepID=UPI001C45951C|nr:phytanoyl-CoA dioxygenase family protein [Streptomyces sp. TRM70350]MBV7698371.1 phytanoyl-CoA dioxygenase family protein [Streptomyces sp. TRM70350]
MLSPAQITDYRSTGFLLTDSGIGSRDLERVREEVARLEGVEHPGRVLEKDGTTVRGLHGCHQVSELFGRLVRLPRILDAARQLVGGDVYVHQVKVNAKRALHGDVWPWHQDYVFWQHKDGMRRPLAVNAAIFLDEITEFNGPLLLIPGSHRKRVPQNLPGNGGETAADNPGTASGNTDREHRSGASGKQDWLSNLSADLDFRLRAEQLTSLVAESHITSATGPAGALLFFDPRIVHGSGTNMSPFDRRVALFTYNSVTNPLSDVASPRPEFLAARDYRPLSPLSGAL